MVDQAPTDKAVICDTPNATPTEGDAQAMPLTSASASEETAPVSPAPGSETDVAKAMNDIAPAAGTPDQQQPAKPEPEVCAAPQGTEQASPQMIADAVLVHKPDAGQSVTYQVASGQNYNLDFNTKDTIVETQGQNMVIRFADGAVIILEKFDAVAGNSKLIVDGCEAVSGGDFMKMAGLASSLSQIAPAAGGNVPAGPQANTAPGSGGGAGFGQYVDGGLPSGPKPLGALGPTSLNYKLIDGLTPEGGVGQPGGEDGKPSIDLKAPLNVVDETGGGGAGGDFSTPRTNTGPFSYDLGPDGAGSVKLISGPTGLTHHGDPVTVTISVDGFTATGTVPGGDTVFTFTINPVTSTYTFTQNGSLDHPDPTDPDEALDLPFVIRVTDADGDYVDGTAIMRVLDDAPMAVSPATVTVDETDGGALHAGGTVNFSYGGDGAGSIKLVGGPAGLTSHGTAVTVDVTDTVITGTAAGITVFTLTLNQATGAWDYQQFASLDHPDASDPNDALNLGFTIRVTDYDGDHVDTAVTVAVLDDGPQVFADSSAVLDESNGLGTAGGLLGVSFGQDGAGSVVLTSGPTGLTSHGQPVNVIISPDGHTAVGTAGALIVFILTVDPATGAYTFSLASALDHPDALDPNDALNLGFGVTVTDGDGDSVTTTLQVTVLDDAPTAGSVHITGVSVGDPLTTGSLPHIYGTDGAGDVKLTGSVAGLASGGEPVTVTVIDTGAIGKLGDGTVVFTLTLTGDGNYIYAQNLPLDGAPSFSIGYTVTDYDGDTAPGVITIDADGGHINGLPTAGDVSGTVDETGGFDSISGTLTHDFGPDGAGGVKFTDGPAGLVSHGVPVISTVSADGLTVTGMAGAVVVYTLTVDPASGAYIFTQMAALDHPDATDANDALNLAFHFSVTDADGDAANATLTVAVLDDGPVAGASTVTVDETGGFDTATGAVSFVFGQDGVGQVTLLSGPTGLHSAGVEVVNTVSVDGLTITGMAGGEAVYTITLDPVTGGYSFAQLAQLDHPDTGNPDDVLNLSFHYSVTDADGDTATSEITVAVHDDAPVAHDDVNLMDMGSHTATGNVVTGLNGGAGAADVLSTDLDNKVVKVSFGGTTVDVPATGTVSIDGDHGTLTIAADGSYTYTLNPDAPGSGGTTATMTPLVLTDAANGVNVGVTAVQVAGGVQFTVNLLSGIADLNGFYLDVNGDGGPILSLGGGNNMNSTAGFDYAHVLGTVGGNDADVTSATFTISGISLSDLDGSIIGLRATSVGEDRADSFKLTGEMDVTVTPDGDNCQPTSDQFTYVLQDGDGDTSAANLTVESSGDICNPHQPPTICVTVDQCVSTTTEKLTFNNDFSETRTWQGFPKESVAVDKSLIGMTSGNLVIGGNYAIPDGLASGVPQHKVTITFDGENAGYSNSLGWFVVGPNGEMSDVRMAVLNSDAFAKGGKVDLGYVPAGSEVEFFIVPNGAQINNYASLPAGGSYQFWSGGAPGSVGAHLATVDDPATSIKLYYVSGSGVTEIRAEQQGVFFATHENLNQDGMDHIISGVDPAYPNDIMMGFEDLKLTSVTPPQDLDYNDLVFRVSVGPACGTIVRTCADINLTSFVSDPDSTHLSAAVVKIATGLTGDALDLGEGYSLSGAHVMHGVTDTGVVLTHNADGGFSLSGDATLATYQAILSAAELHNSNGTIEGSRTLTFQVTDDTGLQSNVAQVSFGYADTNCISNLCGDEQDEALACGVKEATSDGRGDLYVYNSTKGGCDTIVGFDSHHGDRLDVHNILDGHSGSMTDLSNYIRVENDGCGNTVVQMDNSGSGCHFEAIASLHGVTGVTLDSMVSDGSLDVGRFLNS